MEVEMKGREHAGVLLPEQVDFLGSLDSGQFGMLLLSSTIFQ